MKKDKNLCYNCQKRTIEYRTTPTGCPTDRGVCRECHELACSRMGKQGYYGIKRAQEKTENTYETKFGVDR